MTTRLADESHQTRGRLIEAGIELAEQLGLTNLSIDVVVHRAAVAKGTFYVHFTSRDEFLVALHRRFHDELRATISAATKGLPAGVVRLHRATTAYLEGCLRASGVKAMLLQARGIPAIAEEVSRSNDRFASAAAIDFEDLGVEYPMEAACLFVAMAAEVALCECASRRPEPKLRSSLWRLATGGPEAESRELP